MFLLNFWGYNICPILQQLYELNTMLKNISSKYVINLLHTV